MRALLLFNPAAGSGGVERLRTVEAVAEALRGRGVAVDVAATEGAGTAGRQAAASRADVVFACGGDGTVHEVLQGLVLPEGGGGARPGLAALGVVPLGSANALARDLGLPMDPVAAALRQLQYVPTLVPVGRIEYAAEYAAECAAEDVAKGVAKWASECAGASEGTTARSAQHRYFIAMAGAGPHGTLLYDMAAGSFVGKRHVGRMAYYLRSAGVFLERSVPSSRRSFAHFTVEFTDAAGRAGRCEAVSAIAVRLTSLGGLFHRLARGGSVTSVTLRLIVVRPPATLALPLWFGMSWLGLGRWNPLVKVLDVSRFACVPAEGKSEAADLQADGEWLGRGPAEISIERRGLRLLMPSV